MGSPSECSDYTRWMKPGRQRCCLVNGLVDIANGLVGMSQSESHVSASNFHLR